MPRLLVLTLVALCLSASLEAAALGHVLERPDGTAITWYLDAPAAASFPVVAILQGSECLRVSDKYGPWIDAMRAAGIGVLRVEKPGLRGDTPVGECPREYLRLNTLDRRLLDLVSVVGVLRGDRRWDRRIVLVGGSEGGMVAAGAAPLIPETCAVALISSGGGQSFHDELLDLVAAEMRRAGAPEARVAARLDEMRATMRDIVANPTPDKEWMSDDRLARNTWLWWAGALPFTPLRPLLQLRCPILVVHGDADAATPLRSAQQLEEAFHRAGRSNLELRRYPGGHAPSGKVLQDVLQWVIARLASPAGRPGAGI